MKTLLAISLFLLLSMRAMGQNESLLPLFDQAKSYFCPALTGDKGKASGYVIGGYQYFNYYNYYSFGNSTGYLNKNNLNLAFSSPIYTKGKHRISLGAYYAYQLRDEQGPYILNKTNLRINLAYSYKSKAGTFSIGANGDLFQMKTDLSYIQKGYTTTGHFFNTGAGISFRSKNERFYAGASANNLVKQNLFAKNIGSYDKYYYYTSTPIYYLNTGLDIPLNKDWILTPAINISYNITTSISSNIMTEWRKRFLFGLQYNLYYPNEMGGFRLGYKAKALAFHYAYNLYLSRLSTVNSGQHTLGIVFTLGR